jgi:hypothetical protein
MRSGNSRPATCITNASTRRSPIGAEATLIYYAVVRARADLAPLPLPGASVHRFVTFTAAAAALCLTGSLPPPSAAAGSIVVAADNHGKEQPRVAAGSLSRTRETGGSFEGKYKRVIAMLVRDRALVGKIKRVAAIYGVDPIHMLGAIVAEHTYNVDSFDTAQGYVVKAAAYLGTDLSFAYKGVSITEFVARPEFDGCKPASSDYDRWNCREQVWKSTFMGKTVDGVRYPNDRFVRVFFQPLYAGQTFGLGQLSPLTALMVSDVVAAKGGLPKLDPAAAPAIYHAIMDPDSSLHYMAAIIRVSIDAYRAAGFDISKTPGAALARQNKRGGKVVYPQENYFGWFVNEKRTELEALL